MDFKLSHCLRELKLQGVQLAPEEFCDALWLTALGFVEGRPRIIPPTPHRQDLPQPSANPPAAQPNQTAKPTESPARHPVHALGGSGERTMRGSLISLPAAPAIAKGIEFDRAFKPLRQRRVIARTVELDDEATVTAIAETGIWQIIMRPARGRWLDIVVVVEQSPTMRIWQETAREFRQLLWRTCSPRSLRTFHIEWAAKRLRVHTSGGRQVSNHAPAQGQGDQLILVLSDAMSFGWLTADIPELLAQWAKSQTTTLVQMLPEPMWRRTALRKVLPTLEKESSPAVDAPNAQWAQVTVTTLEPDSLRGYARVLAGITTEGIVSYRGSRTAFQVISSQSVEEKKPFDPQSLSPEQIEKIFRRFEDFSSPAAKKLARHLASAPLVLPVMRLVQRVLVPESAPSQLAEIFLSGIMFRQQTELGVQPQSNQLVYDFLPGIRERLIDLGGLDCLFATAKLISNYVEKRLGKGGAFTALLEDTTAAAREWPIAPSLGKKDEPFANVARVLLEHMGYPNDSANTFRESQRIVQTISPAQPDSLGKHDLAESPPQSETDDINLPTLDTVGQADRENGRIFISAVIREFERCRQTLSTSLRRAGIQVTQAGDFPAFGESVLEKLDGIMRNCDVVIHLIGNTIGAKPLPSEVTRLLEKYPDFDVRLPVIRDDRNQSQVGFSYVHWEAYFAIYHRRPLFVYQFNDSGSKTFLSRDVGQLSLSVADGSELQQQHCSRLQELGCYAEQCESEDQLQSMVLADLTKHFAKPVHLHSYSSVFISYRQISEMDRRRVRVFAERLRSSGIRVILDQFYLDDHPGGPNEGWEKWSNDHARQTSHVIIIGTQSWFQCFDKTHPPGTGLGAASEADIIRYRIYDALGIGESIRIVLFNDADAKQISYKLQSYHRFHADRDFDGILDWLKDEVSTPTARADYDFFISYASADEAWAKWIGWQLHDQGHSVFQHSDIDAGSNWIAAIDKALKRSTRMIAILSPAYLKSQVCQAEWNHFSAQDPTGSKRRILPVRVAQCALSGLFQARVFLDLVGKDEEAARRDILNVLVRDQPANAPAYPVPEIQAPPFPSFEPKQLTAMISGTALDMPKHRAAVREACLSAGIFPISMESLPASDATRVALTHEMVDKADLFIGIYGFRYGWVPSSENISITEIEFNHALDQQVQGKLKEILVFMASDDHPITVDQIDTDPIARRRLASFKERAANGRIIKQFRSIEELQRAVSDALLSFKQRNPGSAHHSSIEHSRPLVRSNLPAIQRFFGRDKELAQLTADLRPTTPGWGSLIDGPGGIGKTTLAIRAAELAAPGNFDNIIFLSAKQTAMDAHGVHDDGHFAVSSFYGMIEAIARRLEKPEITQAPADVRPRLLIDELASTRTLLVLDNLETLTDADQRSLFVLLSHLPRTCKALLTSRSLVTATGKRLKLQQMDQNAALQTLADIAHDNPTLAATTEADRLRLFTETGGNPLLLTWTAWQIGGGHCVTIADAIEYLRNCPRENDPNEFIFGDVMNSLSPSELSILAALSHLRAPISSDYIATMSGIGDGDCRKSLKLLVNRSLVIDSQDKGRYSLIPLVAEIVRKRHPQQVEEAGDLIASTAFNLIRDNGHSNHMGFAELSVAWPLIAAALPRFVAGTLNRLHLVNEGLILFFEFTGRWDEWLWFEHQVERKALSEGDALGAGSGIYWAGIVHHLRRQKVELQDCALRLPQFWDNSSVIIRPRALCSRLTGMSDMLLGNFQSAVEAFSRALDLARSERRQSAVIAMLTNDLASAEREAGHYEQSERHYHEGLRMGEDIGYEEAISISRTGLAELAIQRKHFADAEALARAALQNAEQLGRLDMVADSCHKLAQALNLLSRNQDALPFAQRAFGIYTQLNSAKAEEAGNTLRICQG